jgi:hypothetical protein
MTSRIWTEEQLHFHETCSRNFAHGEEEAIVDYNMRRNFVISAYR